MHVIPATGFGLAFLACALDQLTKWVMVSVVMTPPRIIEITPFFNLMLGWNRGVSFGLFDASSPYAPWMFSTVSLIISVALLGWLYNVRRIMPALALGLIVGGAVGNVIDRLRFGAVADFLDVHVAGYHWPAFNLADSAITLGVVLLIYDSLFGRQESPKKQDDG